MQLCMEYSVILACTPAIAVMRLATEGPRAVGVRARGRAECRPGRGVRGRGARAAGPGGGGARAPGSRAAVFRARAARAGWEHTHCAGAGQAKVAQALPEEQGRCFCNFTTAAGGGRGCLSGLTEAEWSNVSCDRMFVSQRCHTQPCTRCTTTILLKLQVVIKS